MEIEDDVQLADIAVVFVHLLDVAMHDLERDQLIVCIVRGSDEEKRGISAVDYFRVCPSHRCQSHDQVISSHDVQTRERRK